MMQVSYWTGDVETTMGLTYWNGGTEVPFLSTGLMAPGYSDVPAMLGDDPFYIAHRGGSANFPEMAMWSYTQSVAHGAGALEFSTSPTSDGVWIGLHDQYLDRTSLGTSTTTLPVAGLTWAQVQGYTINQKSRSEPYPRIEELLEAYGDTHVLFIDPKYGVAQIDALFEMLDNWPKNRIVIKFDGTNANVGNAAKAAGFTTWGYYYDQSFYLDQLPVTHTAWDILGMEYGGSQAAWDLALSFGKPVIGHICPTETAANTALGKGAAGLMCSGVQQIIPGPKALGVDL